MSDVWPALPLEEWSDTRETLHRWTQVIGKVRLEKAPPVNHWWHVALYVSSRGLTTSAMPDGERTFQIDVDFVDHRLDVATSDGRRAGFDLEPMSVAAFHHRTLATLSDLGVEVAIWPGPVEIPDPVTPLDRDEEHAVYEPEWATRCWRALVQADRTCKAFRDDFLGKASPVHFFWGSFDLASTRFSGRQAPEHPGGFPNLPDRITREAYSHECWSAGWWPGPGLGEPAFYAYAYPAPDGFADADVGPDDAFWSDELSEWVLPYDAVRTASDPDAAVEEFLASSYRAAADLGGWDRAALERGRSRKSGR